MHKEHTKSLFWALKISKISKEKENEEMRAGTRFWKGFDLFFKIRYSLYACCTGATWAVTAPLWAITCAIRADGE